LLALVVFAAGCELVSTDVAVEEIPTAIATPSWRNDIAPVLAETCASSGACHFGPNAQEGLNLEAESSYANVVGVLSQYGPVLVIPGDSAGSFLVRVMSTDIAVRGGYPYRMPLTELPMPAAVVQTIKNWIAQGANNN
jgi:hypothetical protein